MNAGSRKLVLLFFLALLGCTRQVPVDIPHYEPDLLYRSGSIGIYMSPELKDYKYSVSPVNSSLNFFCSFNTYVYPLGEQFSKVLQTVTDSLFDKVYLYNSLKEFERDYQSGRFKIIMSVKSLEGVIKIYTNKESWRWYQPLLIFVPQRTPLLSSCRIKVVLTSRKEKKGKIYTFPLEATGIDEIKTPSLRCDVKYFASAANQALSNLASQYAQMISHLF